VRASDKEDDAIARGCSFQYNGDYPAAESCFKDTITAEPSNARAWFLLGDTHICAGKYGEALACFERVLALDSDNESARSKVRDLRPVVDGNAAYRSMYEAEKSLMAPIFPVPSGRRTSKVASCKQDRISFSCQCGETIWAKQALSGKRAKCPKCGRIVVVPVLSGRTQPKTALANALSVTCQCGKKLKAKDELAGRLCKCPACGRPVNVPERPAEPASTPLEDNDMEYRLAELDDLPEDTDEDDFDYKQFLLDFGYGFAESDDLPEDTDEDDFEDEEWEASSSSTAPPPRLDHLIARVTRVSEALGRAESKGYGAGDQRFAFVASVIRAFPGSLRTRSTLDGRSLTYLELGQAMQGFAGLLMEVACAAGAPALMDAANELDAISRDVAGLET